MYMMNVLAERGHGVVVYKKILATKATQEVRSILRGEIQPMVSALLTDNELDNIGERLKKLPEPTRGSLISAEGSVVVRADIFAGVFVHFPGGTSICPF